jgi:hypothetical protein
MSVGAGKGEVGFEHASHLVDVLLDGFDFRAIAEQRQFKLKASEDGAQVMRDAGQHRGALLDSAFDAAFHF